MAQTYRINIWNFARTVITLIIAIACYCYWENEYHIVKKGIEPAHYSNNKVFGVHLNRFADIREIPGTMNGGNPYAGFLCAAINHIGLATDPAPFVLEKKLDGWPLYAYPYITETRIVQNPAENLLFGVQRTVILSIKPVEYMPEMIVGLVGNLKGIGGELISVQITDVSLSTITVSGNIPIDMIPVKLDVNLKETIKGESQQQKMLLISDILYNLRGGVVMTPSQYTFVLRKLPFIYKWFSQDIEPGDRILFPTTKESVVIRKVLEFDGNYVVQTEPFQYRPYLDSRQDIVDVVLTPRKKLQTLQFGVINVTNDKFVLGRERYINIALANTEQILPGDLLVTDTSLFPYAISNVQGKIVTLDLLRSYAIQACLSNFDKRTKDRNLASDGESLFFPETSDGCFDSLAYYARFKKSLVAGLHSGGHDWQNLWQAIHYGKPNLVISEMWNRGFELGIRVAHTKKNSSSTSTNSDVLSKKYNGAQIWEVYPGSMLNLYYRRHNPAPIELMIHVLGRVARREYYDQFDMVRPLYFAFAKPRQFTTWLINWHWPVFERLLLNYKVVVENSDFSLWERKNHRWIEPIKNYVFIGNQFPLRLLNHTSGSICDFKLTIVRVRYQVNNVLRVLPLIGKSARLIVAINGAGLGVPPQIPISLPMDETEFEFPIFHRADATPELNLMLDEPYTSSVRVKVLSVESRALQENVGSVKSLFLYTESMRDYASSFCAQSIASHL